MTDVSRKMSDNSIKTSIIKFKNLDEKIQNLLHEAAEARTYSYSPYSQFKVGAALSTATSAKIYRGCNVENASYTVGLCAERTAYVNAISDGHQEFDALAVIASQSNANFTTPCGACRQFISEFGNIDIYLAKPELDDVFCTNLNQLLPHSFTKLSIK